MGYLNEVFNTYYYSSDKQQKENLKDGFKNIVWGTLPYTKLNRFFKYRISYDNITNDRAMELFEKYSYIEYKILKSRYNINELEKEDLIKARINSNYGKYFDKEVYFNKEYYRALAQYKNIYFNYLNGEVEDLEKEIIENDKNVEHFKQESLKNKYDMTWKDYQIFINECFDKIFDNYKPIDEKIKEGNFYPNHILDWDADNYILGYVNKSLNGCLRNYIRDITGFHNKYKWKHGINKYLKVEGVADKYTILQLCVGKYYKTKDELLEVSNDNILKLTKRQKELINQIEEVINKYDEKDIILFNEYGVPRINEVFISNMINKPQRSLNMMIISINNNISKSNENNYCVNCGKKIIKKSNKQKYCDECKKEKELEKYRKYNKKRK